MTKIIPSCLTAFGGKFNAVRNFRLHEYIPPTDYYVEMFAYSAVMFFNLLKRPHKVVLNDADDSIMNFWRVIKNQYDEFEHELKYNFLAPSVFAEYAKREDTVGKAVMFYLRNKNGFCGIPSKGFHYNYEGEVLRKDLSLWNKILNHGVVIFWDLDFREVFARLKDAGRKGDTWVIYEDPPYIENGTLYKCQMTKEDHKDLAKLNAECEHPLVISYGNNDFIHELYPKDSWYILEYDLYHSTKGTMQGRKHLEFSELLISNRPLKRHAKGQDITAWARK